MVNALFRRHAAALLLALLLGLFIGSVLTFGERYVPGFAGISKQVVDDQLYYLVRAHDVIDGHPFLSNPYLAEHKDTAPMQFWLPDYLLAAPLGILGVPVDQGYLVYAFTLPVILFLLTYANAFLLARSRVLALLAASLIHFGIFLFAFIRAPSPQFNFIFFELLLLVLLLYLRSGKRRFALLATLSFGLLFYLYPYFWTFWAAALGIFLTLTFFSRVDTRFRGVFAIFLGGFALGAQYFWSLIEASHLPFYKETVERVGLIYTHFPSGLAVVILGMIVLGGFAYVFWKRVMEIDAVSLLLVSGTLAAVVVVNQHVVTGQNLEFSSHYLLPSVYWFVLAMTYIASRVLATGVLKQIRNMVLGVLGIAVVAVAAYESLALIRMAFSYTPTDVSIQRYSPVFSWLSAHTQKDSVIFADDLMSYYIPAYTPDNVYDSSYAILFFLSNKEVEERFVVNHYWDVFTPEYIAAHERSIFGAQYLDEYAHNQSQNKLRKLLHLPPVVYERIPESAIERVMATAKTIQSESFETALKQYRADYVLWDTTSTPSWKLSQYLFLKKEYEYKNIFVYKVY